eukprot:NODE_19_length_39463_cov_0.396073.p4 type:complete len:541 gc:universal NODE_19_length_39463_cov_0.396073:11951-13573(+)
MRRTQIKFIYFHLHKTMEDQQYSRTRPSNRGSTRGRYNNTDYRPRSRSNDDGYRPRGSNYNKQDNDSTSGAPYRSNYKGNNYDAKYRSTRPSRPSSDGFSYTAPRYSDDSTYRPRYNNADTSYRPRYNSGDSRPRTSNYQPRSNRYSNDRQPIDTPELLSTFSSIVQHRYRQDINVLNLSNIDNDPLIRNKQIKLFEVQSSAMPSLIKYLANTLPTLETIDLSSNPIKSTACLFHLDSLKHLINLSLQGTGIRFYHDLDHVSLNLKNLMLKDTPLYVSELSKGGTYYQDEILKRFPTLKILDDVPIKGIEFDVPANLFPVTILPSCITSDQIYDFIGKYFATFDTNRDILQQVYEHDAYFSIQLNKPKNALMSDYSQYNNMSRNLKYNKDSQKRFNMLYYGNEIGPALMQLPGTIHSFLVDPSKILCDSLGMMIIIHGEFQDLSTSLMIGFDRLFLLTNEFKIKSDMLTIRETSVLPLTRPVDITNEQFELVKQFIKETGMNMAFSILCLKEHMYDINRSKETFYKVKESGQLPPDAFSI